MKQVLRSLVYRLDQLLRQAQGVFEFCDDPACLFRLRVARAGHPIRLSDGEIPAGVKVLELHFWNEHIPRIPPEGPDLAWAVKSHRALIGSCRAIARQMQEGDARLAGAQALSGTTVLAFPGAGSGAERVLTRLGFALLPYRHPLGRFGEFWENLYTWALMWAYNSVSLRQRNLCQQRRTEIWMSTDRFLRLYGNSE